jgi:hypothetical protein
VVNLDCECFKFKTSLIPVIIDFGKSSVKDGDKYICFDSGIKIKLNTGDMVVYNGQDKFTMLSCSNNYVLVIVINVYKK